MSQSNRVRALSPLVGRHDEIKHLTWCWNRARDGAGNVVVISGEAGIGKSRLASEMISRAHADDALAMRLQCSALQSNSDLHPIQDNLTRFAGARRTDPEPVRRDKIRQMLRRAGSASPPESLIAGLAVIAGPPHATHEVSSGQRRRNDLLDAVVAGLLELSVAQPLLLIFEDAQWLDPTTNELLERMICRIATQRLLLLVTARREYDPSWIGSAHTSVVLPRRLSDADTLTLARQVAGQIAGQVAGQAHLSATELQRVVARAEGVPLFVEEFSKERSALGASAFEAHSIPAGLQAVLITRLDKVGPAKTVAQVAAALGRRFSHDTALHVWGGDRPVFEELIAALMTADVLRPKAVQAGVQYSFRHVLLQEAAYASLTPPQRSAIHGRIVRVLEADALDIVADQPDILAQHCERAELSIAAAGYWLAAGKAAAVRGSVAEAINCFKHGLEAVAHSAPDDQRERLEFEITLNLGPAMMALKGYASPEGLETFARARKLIGRSRSSLEEIQVLLGLFNVHLGRGEFQLALDVGHHADQLLAVGYGGYPVLIGQAQCMMGRFREARVHLEQALARYDRTLDADSGLFCQADVVATSFLAKVEFSLGHLDRCGELTQTAMVLARQQGHPMALAIAYLGQLFLATDAGHLDMAHALADEALLHAEQHNLKDYQIWVGYHRAALSLRAAPDVAIARMHQILETANAAGTHLFRPAQLGLLGAAYAGTGKIEAALSFIEQGLRTARATHGLEALPALHRLRARTLAGTRVVEAISELETSIAIARNQSALVEELRSATVLARLLKESDRRGAARDQLANVYAKFTQGLQFPDLKQAGRVLASFDETI